MGDAAGIGLCLDVSHTKLAATFLGQPFSEAVELLTGVLFALMAAQLGLRQDTILLARKLAGVNEG